MAYDEPIYRRRDSEGADPVGAGSPDDFRFAAAPAYRNVDERYQTGGFEVGDQPGPEPGGVRRRRPVPPAVLGDVFDDPAHGEPGRDRLAIHVVWEAVLLVGVVALGYLLYRQNPDALRGTARSSLLVSATALGLLALGAGATLRTNVPNLALGPVAIAAALHFAENGDRGVVAAMWPAVLVAAVFGVLLAILVVGFHVPGWAASLAAALAVIVFIQQRSAPVAVQGEYDPLGSAVYLFCGFAAVALLSGFFGTIKPIRRAVGRFRPVGDPAQRRDGVAAVLAAVAIVLSMVFAVLAGLLLAAGGSGTVRPTTGIEWTGLAMGAALLAGTSAFGRRGGVFGTLLSVVSLTLFIAYANERDWDIALAATAAAAVAAGLVVTRLVESYGRPPSADGPDEDWQPEPVPATAPIWSAERSERPESWSADLPAQYTDRPHRWGGDRWGTAPR